MDGHSYARIILATLGAGAMVAVGGWGYYTLHLSQVLPGYPFLTAQNQLGCTVLPYTGTTSLKEIPSYIPGDADLRGGMQCTFLVHPDLPAFGLHFTGMADNTLGNIIVTEGSNTSPIQTIESSTSYDSTLTKAQNTPTVVDANFDGYQDLRVLNECGATGNCTYNFYLYDPTTHQFVRNAFLSSLGSPSFDAASKKVTASWHSSAGDSENDTFEYASGHYSLVQRVVSVWNEDNTVTVRTYVLAGGKMKLENSSTTPL